MEAKELISLDVGQKHTGLARASSIAKIAEPLKTLPTEKVPTQLKRMQKQSHIELIVIGLPRNLEGSETSQTKWVKEWTAKLKSQIDIPLYWMDEALTTKLQASDFKDQNGDDHAAAAVTILQDFLNTPENDWVMC